MKIRSLFFSLLLTVITTAATFGQAKVVPLEVTFTSLNEHRPLNLKVPEEVNVTLHKGEQLLIKPIINDEIDLDKPATMYAETGEYKSNNWWFNGSEAGKWVYSRTCCSSDDYTNEEGVMEPNINSLNEQGVIKWKSDSQYGVRFEGTEIGKSDITFLADIKVITDADDYDKGLHPYQLPLSPVIHVTVSDDQNSK